MVALWAAQATLARHLWTYVQSQLSLPNTAISSFLLASPTLLPLRAETFMQIKCLVSNDSVESPPLNTTPTAEQIAGSSMSPSDWKRSPYGPGDSSRGDAGRTGDRALELSGPSSLRNRNSIATFTNTAVASPYATPLATAFDNESNPSSPASSNQSVAPTRHETFWLYDGSIILRVENTLFRVHQTILANHSEVFADLFTVPQPDGERMIGGCHVVYLHDDEKDFVDLLNAVYIPDHFETLPAHADLDTILNFIEGILRLSTKYMIRYIRQRCISLLLTKFPHTFERYESKATSSSDRYKSDTVMRAIRIAQENNVPEALPYAYYCLSRFPHKRFLKDRPGDVAWRDKMIALIGRERLQWAQMSISHSFLILFRRSPACVSPLCAHARGPHAEWHELEKQRSPHPLRAYEGWDLLNVCPDCTAYCQSQHLKGRREVWECLPTWFELPPWEKLSEAQNR